MRLPWEEPASQTHLKGIPANPLAQQSSRKRLRHRVGILYKLTAPNTGQMNGFSCRDAHAFNRPGWMQVIELLQARQCSQNSYE
jgi:hypothetical protein